MDHQSIEAYIESHIEALSWKIHLYPIPQWDFASISSLLVLHPPSDLFY